MLNKSKQQIILDRRVAVAKLMRDKKMTMREISAELGISLGTIASDCKAIEKESRKEYAALYEDRIRAEFSTISETREEAFKQWYKGTKGKLKKEKIVRRPLIIDGVDTGDFSEEFTTETLLPDPRYLTTVLQATKQVWDLFGIEPPKELNLNVQSLDELALAARKQRGLK